MRIMSLDSKSMAMSLYKNDVLVYVLVYSPLSTLVISAHLLEGTVAHTSLF